MRITDRWADISPVTAPAACLPVVGLLLPAHNGYVAACVHHTRASTLLSRNLDSFAFNYASLDGNLDITAGLADYNRLHGVLCSGERAPTETAYARDLNSFLSLNHTHVVMK